MKLISLFRVVFIAALLLVGVLYWQSPLFIRATFHELFTQWQFKMPEKGTDFIVQHVPPRAIQRVIQQAFPEYNVRFIETPQTPPHLILKRYYASTSGTEVAHIPYLAYSGEYANMRWKRFHPSGYPFFEITSTEIEGDNFLFMPFIVYGKSNLRALLTKAMTQRPQNKIRPTQIAYISSHCIPVRDEMFTLLRDRFGPQQAVSYGKCLRTPGAEIPGTYHDLTSVYQQHNFVLAMENHDRKGYITEKIMNALEAGAIPLYWGDSHLAHKWFNPEAFIDLKNYQSFEEAADAIYALSQNPEALQKKLQASLFRNNEIPSFLLLNDDEISANEEGLLKEMGQKVRRAYEDYIAHRNQGKPYLKALALTENLRTKIQHTRLGKIIYTE